MSKRDSKTNIQGDQTKDANVANKYILGKVIAYFLSVDPVMQSLLENSTILDGDIDDAQQLVEWMKDKKFGWQICYRASEDGWRGADFHRKCDDVGPTVTLIKCETNVFGGFTDQSWKVPGIKYCLCLLKILGKLAYFKISIYHIFRVTGLCVQTVFITNQNFVDNMEVLLSNVSRVKHIDQSTSQIENLVSLDDDEIALHNSFMKLAYH